MASFLQRHRMFTISWVRGGVCGIIENMNQQYEAVGPTELRLVGYAVDQENKVINTINPKIIIFDAFSQGKSKLILSIGGAMDSGKTTTAAYLCRELKRAGKKSVFINLPALHLPKM